MLDADEEPVTAHASGAHLPGDCLAWERLGVGYRCETWLAWSPRLWCPVVVKFPRPHQVSHPRARQTLAREVAALEGNLHPGLPRLFAADIDACLPYVVMEYLDGPALDDEIDEHGAFDPVDVALVGVQLIAALRAVHARGIAHVDIKPANVVVVNGRPVLLDFGSARRIGAPQPAGRPVGSPGYASPDLEAGEPISAAMDVFGIGATLYELLVGEPPFDFDLDAADRPAPSPLLPFSPVGAVVHRMLAACAGDRPGVAEALRDLGGIAAAAGRPAWPAWTDPTD